MAETETTTPEPAPAAATGEARPPVPGVPLPAAPDLSWMKVPTERPPKPKIGSDGFTLRMADAGTYGYAPDIWPYENDTPRGSYPSRDMGLAAPYTIYDKAEVWADNAADLYEAAIRDQWKPATQIAWNSIEELPEHIEAALDQIFSNISEQQFNSMQVMSGWFKEISYGYHEVKLYLSTQVFDQARHVEAFRKRALSNGGGLGVQTPGFFNRTVYAGFKFTEYLTYVNIIRTSFMLELCEWGDRIGRSQVDRDLFANMASDLRRHLAFGIEHMKHYALSNPAKRRNITNWLDRGEIMLAADLKRDKPLREAFILALGSNVQEGKERLKELRQAQLKRYLRSLEHATVYAREERVQPPLKEAVENP
jgi:hypothetical protein